ncbi:MAG: prepilin-type N-terminal cleavage/methylation domain-containing protein [Pseudomonadota bacterium]|nr:prepilin-type N-terminal cleavage/methylation domain-containing protein [Pseudomonadota bacterium]
MSEGSRRAVAGPTRGFTLIELMIAMLLGLVVIGGALGVMLANRQSYRTSEGLSQIQESARTAFELLAHDVRQAGVTGCNNNGRVANVVVSTGATPWWQSWFGIRGFDGSQADGAAGFGTAVPNNRVNGTDSMQLQGIEGTGLSVVDQASGSFTINLPTTAIARNDILMVCDFDHAAIFKVTGYSSAAVTVANIQEPSTASPRNCSTGLGYPTDCTAGNPYTFSRNSQLARLSAVAWYIGDNNRPLDGGRSLYRFRMDAAAAEEIVTGVTDMQVRYREAGRSDFRDATAVGTWANVNAVMITLTLRSADQRITTDNNVNAGRLERQFTNIVTLRNRVP